MNYSLKLNDIDRNNIYFLILIEWLKQYIEKNILEHKLRFLWVDLHQNIDLKVKFMET